MEPIYSNKTVMDETTCRQFLALTWSHGNGLMRISLIVVAALAATYGVFQVLAGREFVVYALLLFAVAAVAVFLVFFGYLLRGGKYTKEQRRLWGGPTLEKDTQFYGDYFIQQTRLGQQRFLYRQVTKARFGKGSILLFFGSSALQLDRWGFGDSRKSDDFKQFINQKIKQNKSN